LEQVARSSPSRATWAPGWSRPTASSTTASRRIIDAYIERAAVDAPPAELPTVDHRPVELTELNLLRAGVSTVIWATGYGLDHGWIDAPVLDGLGYPRNVRGVAAVPGLYFLGLLWQHSQASASLVGPELDGPYLVDAMGRQARRRRRERALIGRQSPSRS
jgi:putative flavoprotein involved in K+ transport